MMRVSARVLCVVAFLAVGLTVAAAVSSCGIDHCSSCLSNNCLWCEDGYYASGGACVACKSNCRSCALAGRCTSCMDGYKLSYFSGEELTWDTILYGSCETKGSAATCTDPQCTSCIGGKCLYCANGYYLKDSTCTSCAASHCAHCEIAGQCLACESGYKLQYANSTDSQIIINRWGECVNGAVFSSAYAVLIGAALLAISIIAA